MLTTEIPADIDSIAGPLLISYFLHWGLFGVLTMQTYMYYMAFPNDRRAFKCLIYGIYMVDTAQTLILTHDAYNTFAKGFGDLSALDAMQNGWFYAPVLSGIVTCAVQLCYTYRISLLSSSKPLVLLIAAIALMQGISGIVTGVQCLKAGKVSAISSDAFAAALIWLSGSALCDIIIAASMTILLRRANTGMPATRALITKLVRLIVETGCLTATVSLVQLSLFVAFPTLSYHAAFAIILAKVYSNSLLVVFNSRLRVSNGPGNWFESDAAFISYDSGNKKAPKSVSLAASSTRTAGTSLSGIRVQEETWTDNIELDLRDPEGRKKTVML